MKEIEVAIIGAGSAGMRAYREVSKVTDSVALIEGSSYGTTCARVGCMPSKLLIAAAEAAHAGTHAEAFGVHYGARKVDGKAVMKRVREERDRFVGFVTEAVDGWPEHHKVRGYARFKSDHVLQISDGREIRAERIIIATGSRPDVPALFAELGDRLIISDDLFSWQDLPDSIGVFGAGVIGLELGQALHRLGVRTAIFGRSLQVGPLTDPAVLEEARTLFSEELAYYPQAGLESLQAVEGGVEVSYIYKGESRRETFEYVLAATGRIPNLERLGLENISIQCDQGGVPLYNRHSGQVGDSHIFIAGDANDHLQLLHEASDEGQAAGYNAAHFPEVRHFKKSTPLSIVFCDPQIMMVGQSYAELQAEKVDFGIGEINWRSQGRSRVMLVNRGLLRIYGERGTGRLLGAEMIGPRAEHLAHLLAWAHQSHATISEMLERPFYHPVIEEGLRSALRSLNHSLNMGPKPPPRCLDCGPGA
jgi:dihydrolipoamide dehydrogenase